MFQHLSGAEQHGGWIGDIFTWKKIIYKFTNFDKDNILYMFSFFPNP
jgi:hypothetical protein